LDHAILNFGNNRTLRFHSVSDLRKISTPHQN